MESYLSIVHLALAVAAIVPILWPGGRQKLKAVWIGAVSLIVLLAMFQGAAGLNRGRDIAATKRDIVSVLKEKGGMTFEQIFDCCYYRDLRVVNRALGDLVEDGLISQSKKQLVDGEQSYTVRVFSLPGAP